jgi:hypothetical protein
MKKLLFTLSIFCCLVLALVPAVSAIGGDEGWITINCNVNGATVSFDGEYKGIINGGSLTVPVFTTGTPTIPLVWKSPGIPHSLVMYRCPEQDKREPIMPR